MLNWPGESFSATRTYTVRRWDAEAGEIDVDVVRHGSGPATTWAYSCAPGDALHIADPKMSYGHPDVAWLLIAGDETALPAIGRWLEQLPAGQRASVFIEVAERAHIQQLETAGDVDITWLSRDGRPAGTTTLLQDALVAAPWVSDDVYAWVAGEALTLAPIRRWLLEIAPGVAIRVAVTLGVIHRLGLRPQSSGELAAAVGAEASALERLLRYLAALDIVSAADGTWSLRPLGAELDDDRYTEVLSLDTATGRTAVGIVGLLDAARTGGAGHAATFGRSFTDLVDADPALSRSRLHSELAEWTATPLAASALLRDVTDIRVAGPGSGDIARALRAHHPEARVRLLVPPSQARAAADLAAGDTGAGAGAGEIVVADCSTVDRSSPRPTCSSGRWPSSATTTPRTCSPRPPRRPVGGGVLVLEDPHTDETDDEHELELDLELLAVHGGALRTESRLDALAEAAGLRPGGREIVGWGRALRRYERV
ncbi:siderophore-interacting protein [Microbacterium lacticum]